MKKKVNIDLSMKEKRLLLILGAFIILFLAYQFGFVVLMNKASKNNEQIDGLEARVEQLEMMEVNKSVYTKGIKENNEKINEIYSKFVNDTTAENNILFIKDIEDKTGVEVSEIDLYDKAVISNQSSEANTTTTDTTTSTSADGSSVDSSVGTTQSTEQAMFVQSGFNYMVKFNFKASYNELKEMITYINQYPYFRTIDNVSVVFDSDTGELMGELTLNIYTLVDATNAYEEPISNVHEIGVDNIFGTIH